MVEPIATEFGMILESVTLKVIGTGTSNYDSEYHFRCKEI